MLAFNMAYLVVANLFGCICKPAWIKLVFFCIGGGLFAVAKFFGHPAAQFAAGYGMVTSIGWLIFHRLQNS